MTRRSVEGTLGILKASLKSKTVKRVVYTSTESTVQFDGKGGEMVDESSWSDVDFLKDLNGWRRSYMISKTITERAALDFAEEHGLDIVTLLPSFVVGPFICPRFPGSVNASLAMVLGMLLLACKYGRIEGNYVIIYRLPISIYLKNHEQKI